MGLQHWLGRRKRHLGRTSPVRWNDSSSRPASHHKPSIKLDHHAEGWGEVRFALVLDKVDEGVFQVPTSDQARYVAIKKLNKRVVREYLDQGGQEDPYKEIQRMQAVGDNVHVLSCVEALECEDYIYIITPKACEEEGTLCEAIAHGSIDEQRAWKLYRQILGILLYLERHGIYHRDVSPDNFLFLTPDNLVIFDLALSIRLPYTKTESPLESSEVATIQRTLLEPQGTTGTLAYLDPSVYTGTASVDGVACDLWAATLLLYNMLTGHILYRIPHPTDVKFRFFILARALSSNPMNPVAMQAMKEIMEQDEHHSIVQLAIVQRKISPRAMCVLENVLNINPSERWTLAQVVESDYVQVGPEEA